MWTGGKAEKRLRVKKSNASGSHNFVKYVVSK